MRIAYGVFGYGRGHATRAAAVLADLRRRHEVRIFAGGDAYDQLAPEYPVVRVPGLSYSHGADGQVCELRTMRRNAASLLDLVCHGPRFRAVRDAVREFGPDVVISDAEPWLHRVARTLRIPRIGFDHFGIMVYCRPSIPLRDRLLSRRDVLLYSWLMGRPRRIIVSSFYEAPPRWPGVRVIGPLLRDEILTAKPRRGDYLLAYLNKGHHQLTPAIERALRESNLPIVVYGTGRQGSDGNLDFRPPGNRSFVQDMAGCRAIVSTAGNQLVGEAVHLGKPMLVMPEASVEQRLNAHHLERMGLGRQVAQRDFDAGVLRDFLAHERTYRENIRRAARNGRRAAVETIERFVTELTGGPVSLRVSTRVA